jgi:integrase
MPEKRVTVWVQRFKDRPHLMLQWNDPDTGKRKSQSAGTADEKKAEQARADLEADLNHGRYQEASRMTWERFRELFEAEFVTARRPHTRHNYEDTFNAFERLCRPTTLRGVNERAVSAFAAALRQEPGQAAGETLAAGTIKVRMQFLRTALRWAAVQKFIPAVPQFPAVKVPRKRPQPVPTESFEKLLAKSPDQHTRAFLLCGWLAGMRMAEALALEWEETDKAPWVDFGRQRVHFPAAFVKAVEDQWVPLDPALREALESLPRQGRSVFGSAGGRPLTRQALNRRIARLARRAGVKLNMRSLRRGFGCRYAGKVSAQVLQRLMRHSSITITMTYYANVDEAAMEAVLGPQRNGSRNAAGAGRESAADAKPQPPQGEQFTG